MLPTGRPPATDVRDEAVASAPRPLLCLVLSLALGAGALGLPACDDHAPPPSAAAPGRTVDPATPWSRTDFGARPADAKSGTPQASATVDPEALRDLLRAVPSAAPGPTDPAGGTRIATDTGTPTTASPVTVELPPQRAKKASVQLLDLDVQADMASPAIEREARAQLYHPLVTRCRAKDGTILPPDSVLLDFPIDADGYIVPHNITATAMDPAYRAAAECMRRELSGLVFRGPPGARGNGTQVKMTVPSVD